MGHFSVEIMRLPGQLSAEINNTLITSKPSAVPALARTLDQDGVSDGRSASGIGGRFAIAPEMSIDGAIEPPEFNVLKEVTETSASLDEGASALRSFESEGMSNLLGESLDPISRYVRPSEGGAANDDGAPSLPGADESGAPPKPLTFGEERQGNARSEQGRAELQESALPTPDTETSNLAAERAEEPGRDVLVAPRRSAEPATADLTSVMAAVELLRQPAGISLNLNDMPDSLSRAHVINPSAPLDIPAGGDLDRLIAAMAAFHDGSGVGAMSLNGPAPLDTAMTQLAPAA